MAAAEKGQRSLEDAKVQSQVFVDEAKAEAARIIDQAHQRGQKLIADAKQKASEQAQGQLNAAQVEIQQQRQQVKQGLMDELSGLVISCSEAVLGRKIDKADNDRLIAQLVGAETEAVGDA